LPTPHVVDEPPEFLEANIRYVASWLEAEGRSSSCPRRKENWKAKKSLSSFCAIVVLWRRRGPPQYDEPDLFGVLPSFSMPLPPPVVFSLLPSPLFLLSVLPVIASFPSGALPLPLPFVL